MTNLAAVLDAYSSLEMLGEEDPKISCLNV